MESLERAISNQLKRRLGLPRCLSGAALYGNSNALHLPCSSLVEEFKIMKTRELLQYTESEDPKVAAAGIQIRSGRKWSAKRELQVAEERLRHKAILGSIAKGRAGLGFFPSTHTNSAKGKERRQLIQEEVREGVEEVRYCKMVSLSQQRAWTRWEDLEKKRITWSDCWWPDFSEIRFLIKSVYDVLLSPTNLHIWEKRETPNCQLCARKGSLQHILSSCPKALGDGWYYWRHDQALKVIANEVTKAMRASNHRPGKKLKQINFVKAGEKILRKRREKTNLLSSTDDWQLIVDLETQLKFPRHIDTVTSLRLDLILHSDNTKQCIIWELTVSWEEYITLANERKRSKYQGLVEQCQQKSWKIHFDPVEVGCRGFAGQSLGRTLEKIGIVGAARVRALKDITNTVLKVSKWIWLKRSEEIKRTMEEPKN